MEQCAIVLNGTDVIKVSNLKRKYNKIINNPEMKILEECSKEELEDRYLYWKDKYKAIEEESEEVKKYYFSDGKGSVIVSIYPNLDNIPGINKEEWYVIR
ncbi:hypothetical protein [Intestinibacter sp.]|uniref:hypothetical protein n=1 Tax=Intestinibacter sp. TaxID=1965304 RepID=UPI003F140A98